MITKKQFENLSIIGLACHLINFKYTIEIVDDGLKVYANVSNFWEIATSPRLERFKKYDYPSLEMNRMDVPKNDPLYPVILKLGAKYILEDDPINEVEPFFEKA